MMKCQHCGAHLDDGSHFCSECGYPVDDHHTVRTRVPEPEGIEERRVLERQAPINSSEPPGKKIRLIILALVGLIALITVFVGARVLKGQGDLKQAQAYMDAGDYEAAYQAFLALDSAEAKDGARLAKHCIDAQNILNVAKEQKINQQFITALSNLQSIPEDTEGVYEAAQAEIQAIQLMVYTSADQSMADGDFAGADKLLNDYLLLFPTDATAAAKKADVKAKKEEAEAAAQLAEDTEKALAQAQLEAEMAEAQAQATENQAQGVIDAADYGYSDSYLNGLYGLETTVTSESANIRSGPSIDAPIVTTVSRGSYVYIYDVQPDVGRIWCRAIITSIKTGSSYDAWISSRNLDYSL